MWMRVLSSIVAVLVQCSHPMSDESSPSDGAVSGIRAAVHLHDPWEIIDARAYLSVWQLLGIQDQDAQALAEMTENLRTLNLFDWST